MNLDHKTENHFEVVIENNENQCRKYESCNKNNKYEVSKPPKRPYIGRYYGKDSTIPNLVFISLDPGSTKENYSTIEEIRNRTENNIPKKNKGTHWCQTFELARLILSTYTDNEDDCGKLFIHTNSVKCSQNKPKNKQADSILFENCIDYVRSEITLYNVDILVTQGTKARDVIKPFFKLIGEPIVLKGKYKNKQAELKIYKRQLEDKCFIHIPMYHPSYFRGYWKQKEILRQNIDSLKDLFEELNE